MKGSRGRIFKGRPSFDCRKALSGGGFFCHGSVLCSDRAGARKEKKKEQKTEKKGWGERKEGGVKYKIVGGNHAGKGKYRPFPDISPSRNAPSVQGDAYKGASHGNSAAGGQVKEPSASALAFARLFSLPFPQPASANAKDGADVPARCENVVLFTSRDRG
ncbi:hypothetical protein KM043_013702 [Ampulex compressa]|nr:hypothetical protein KM043_013702 [Ampulex compressa]